MARSLLQPDQEISMVSGGWIYAGAGDFGHDGADMADNPAGSGPLDSSVFRRTPEAGVRRDPKLLAEAAGSEGRSADFQRFSHDLCRGRKKIGGQGDC